ncbi:proton-conducting transporter transmembrane domain-containing protein [Caldisericum exile]|uniref:Na(+)/H(+) antiporter subunit D n=1 Tax=Caldisericum exile (strain DSM 21853 / NBRC 104410 / AZM16c01) TaxID=511051 RepID=A0A7U6GDR4_CALEA|nr:proton-conducting transporter membrane subunit [Caldisericum exile]BAL80537.1 putative Na(+)/H(+) antiporter subunit D [Caldisericum exile AZM16c01]
MNFSLLMILLTPFFGGLLAYAGSALHKSVRNIFFLIFLFLPFVELYQYANKTIDNFYYLTVLGQNLSLGINSLSFMLSILFALIFLLAGIFLLFEFDKSDDGDLAVLEFSFLEGAVFGVLFARDILSFFIFFELIAVLVFFLVGKGYKDAHIAQPKYITWALIGANSMLAAIMLLFFKTGSFGYSEIAGYLSTAPTSIVLTTFVLFAIGFLVEASTMPLHVWAPITYTEAPDSVSVVLSSVVKKVGLYLFTLFTFSIFGLNLFSKIMPKIFGSPLILYILQWVGAFTIIVGTFVAIVQEDAKKILAWSSIAQSGYILLGLSLGTSLGVAGGLLHIINHSIFKGILFFVVGGVIYRTGTKDLSELGGLIKKMPVSFIAMLFAIIATAGIPPLNGFASKYLIYEALIQNKEPILLTVALLGGTGSFMYVYRLIHSIFLGQLPKKYESVKEVPILMQIPMLVLSLLALLFGILPGIPMYFVSKAEAFLGFEPIKYNLTGFPEQSGLHAVNILAISLALTGGFVVAALIFYLLPRARKVHQLDNYYAGEVLTEDVKYNYSFGFYSFFDDIIRPFNEWSVDKIYEDFTGFVKTIGDYLRRVYTGNLETYVSLGIIVLTIFSLIYILGGVLW